MKQLKPNNQSKQAKLLLRLGLAAVYLYAGISGLIDPQAWIGFMPQFVGKILPATTALLLFSIFQIALSIWLLSGWKTRYAAILTALTTAALMVVNLGALIVTFRDIAIIFAALALAVMA